MWGGATTKIQRLGPVFLEHGGVKVLSLDPGAAGGDDANACTSVLFLGARSVDFAIATGDALSLPGPDDDPALASRNMDDRLRSASGAAMLVRCGASRKELARVAVEMLSARGTLEVLVARGARARDLKEILPERASGPTAPLGDPGRPLEPGPLGERVTRAAERAKLDGASHVGHVEMRSSAVGTGEFILKLSPGCHRFELMADIPTTLPRRATDVDAELRDAESGKVLARDRADSPDARIEKCFGSSRLVTLAYTGASGPSRVTVSDALWALPEHLPSEWGPRARAGFAEALLKRHLPPPAGAPTLQALGVQGTTVVPIQVVPGSCYLAVVSLVRGEARGLRVSAEIGDRAPRDEAVDRPDSASIAFCAGRASSGIVRVETRGNAPWWVLAVWPMGGGNR